MLRFYQQKSEKFENILHPYASCLYAWDEPCHPQRLSIEVPGKGSLGSYRLDDLRNHMLVRLSTTSKGLTGLLQSPIRGAEKHGLPGILLGIATGVAGLVARPVVSILEVSGRTAQSIRNRSNPRQLHRFRVRLPRPVIRDSPLRPYSWEEAVGAAVLQKVEGNRLKDEVFVTCIALGMPGTFIVVTERLLLKATSASLAAAALNEDVIPAGPDWDIHLEIAFNDIIHFDREGWLLNVLTDISETHFKRPKDPKISKQNYVTQFFPFTNQSIEFPDEDVAEKFLHLLQTLINKLKEHPSRRIIR